MLNGLLLLYTQKLGHACKYLFLSEAFLITFIFSFNEKNVILNHKQKLDILIIYYYERNPKQNVKSRVRHENF